jgi:hypothetical protein
MAIKLIAPAGVGGVVQGRSGTTYTIASDGTISSVSPLDVDALINDGFLFAIPRHNTAVIPAPVAASAGVTVASVALANGTLTVAAQPDVPRQLQIIVNPGTTAISAGNLAMTYTANDGTAQVDNFSMVMAAGAAAGTIVTTLSTSKGVEHLASAVVTAMSGGTSPAIQIGTNNYLALPVDPGFVDFAVTSEKKITPTAGTLGLSVPADNTVSTVAISAGALYTPTTVPDGTHSLSIGYNYTYPG